MAAANSRTRWSPVASSVNSAQRTGCDAIRISGGTTFRIIPQTGLMGYVPESNAVTNDELRRSLGVFDAVVIGLGSMIGAGIFAALGPAARAAGSGLLLALVVAAFVAYCNATSSAEL